MVKFSKQLEGQLVPEWRAAYVTYTLLKKDLEQIREKRATEQEGRASEGGGLPSFRAKSSKLPSGLSRMSGSFGSFISLAGNKGTRRPRQSSVVVVHKMDSEPWETYETVLADPTDVEGAFFDRLDAQFNTVSQFYKTKEDEFIVHADALDIQLKALLDMREAYVKRQARIASLVPLPTNDLEAGRVVSQSPQREMHLNASVKNDLQGTQGGSARTTEEPGAASSVISLHRDQELTPRRRAVNGTTNNVSLTAEEAGVEIREVHLHRDQELTPLTPRRSSANPRSAMRIKIPATTPGTTISTLYHSLCEDIQKQVNKAASSPSRNDKGAEDSVTKKNIQLAEKMLRSAFVEYYRGLGMLRSYSSLNTVAFAKILKKYDKLPGQRTASLYLKAVESSYFHTSDKIIKLMDLVEILFTKQFSNSIRKKAMTSLRPAQKRASHNVTFALGLFSGGTLALLVVFGVLLSNLLPEYRSHDTNDDGTQKQQGNAAYFETVFPVFSMLALILIHMYMYGGNLYLWRRMHINYAFIFEFRPGTELRHRQVLMVTSVLTTLLMGAMVGQLALHPKSFSPFVDLIPFILFAMMLILLLLPFNICYRSSRVFFLKSLVHILASPFYKIVLADFFLADQLTSQVPMLRNLEYTMCYYLGGYFRTGNSEKCRSYGASAVTYVIAFLPYWWRLMQCVRRFGDEADHAHVANGGKYFSALVAVTIGVRYVLKPSQVWRAIYIAAGAVATIFQLYWDIVVDWGLLRRHSKNPWLRDDLIMPNKKYLYFVSMILNVVLRIAWVQSVTSFQVGGFNRQVTIFIFATLEVIRRGQWNFYRLENEHLNNVGKYRATKTVPLPFEAIRTDKHL